VKKRFTSILFFFLVSAQAPLFGQQFDFSKELRKASHTSKRFDLIAIFQNIVGNLKEESSTRLCKKFIQKIKMLHSICMEDKNPRIQTAFKILLKTAVANKKLSTADYRKELPAILALWQDKPTNATNEEVKPTVEIASEVAQEKPENENYITDNLKQELSGIDKNSIRVFLLLKKIINQTKERGELLERLDKIEQQLKNKSASERISRRVVSDEEEISPLLQKLVLMEQFPKESSALFDLDKRSE